jgi:hypothetical protein
VVCVHVQKHVQLMVPMEIHAILKTNVHPIMNVDGLRVVTSVGQALWELLVRIKDAIIISKTIYVIVMRACQSPRQKRGRGQRQRRNPLW